MVDPPLRILFLSWRDRAHPDGGGSEVYVHEVARHLARLGHDVTVHTSRPAGSPLTDTVDGVRYFRRGGRLTVYPHGLRTIVRESPDVVVDVVNGLPFGSPLVRRHGVVALVHHLHREQWSIIYPDWRGRLGWFIESKVVPRLYRRSQFVTVSNTSRSDLVSVGVPEGNIHVVPNGLTAGPSNEGRSVLPRLVVLARLVPHKQIEHALEVLRRLRPRVPGLTLDIVGEGWWRGQLKAAASALGVSDAVTIHGWLAPEQRDGVLAQAWLMVLPSVKEGWGIAVTEAAAQGTPTIGYRSSGGLTESITDGVTGWLVDDRDQMALQVEALLERPELLRTAGEAARTASRRLDWAQSAQAFDAVLRQVSGRRRR